jgi:hypothetical protein
MEVVVEIDTTEQTEMIICRGKEKRKKKALQPSLKQSLKVLFRS